MTDEQIKQIAEEYGKCMSDNVLYQESYADDAERVLEFLAERYCVVERSKVVEIIVPETANDEKITIITKGQFGDVPSSETFNKKEE